MRNAAGAMISAYPMRLSRKLPNQCSWIWPWTFRSFPHSPILLTSISLIVLNRVNHVDSSVITIIIDGFCSLATNQTHSCTMYVLLCNINTTIESVDRTTEDEADTNWGVLYLEISINVLLLEKSVSFTSSCFFVFLRDLFTCVTVTNGWSLWRNELGW